MTLALAIIAAALWSAYFLVRRHGVDALLFPEEHFDLPVSHVRVTDEDGAR